jgi:hypothetical protein
MTNAAADAKMAKQWASKWTREQLEQKRATLEHNAANAPLPHQREGFINLAATAALALKIKSA